MTYSFKLIKAHHIISHQTRTFLNFTCFHQHTCPHSIFSRGSSSPLEHTSKLNERKNMPENYSNDLLFYCLRTVALLQALSFREYLWYSFFFFFFNIMTCNIRKIQMKQGMKFPFCDCDCIPLRSFLFSFYFSGLALYSFYIYLLLFLGLFVVVLCLFVVTLHLCSGCFVCRCCGLQVLVVISKFLSFLVRLLFVS